jgi:hypothetical protein
MCTKLLLILRPEAFGSDAHELVLPPPGVHGRHVIVEPVCEFFRRGPSVRVRVREQEKGSLRGRAPVVQLANALTEGEVGVEARSVGSYVL